MFKAFDGFLNQVQQETTHIIDGKPTQGIPAFAAHPPPAGKALVMVHRVAQPMVHGAKLYQIAMDGRVVCQVKDGETVDLIVEPGVHTVQSTSSMSKPSDLMQLNIAPGQCLLAIMSISNLTNSIAWEIRYLPYAQQAQVFQAGVGVPLNGSPAPGGTIFHAPGAAINVPGGAAPQYAAQPGVVYAQPVQQQPPPYNPGAQAGALPVAAVVGGAATAGGMYPAVGPAMAGPPMAAPAMAGQGPMGAGGRVVIQRESQLMHNAKQYVMVLDGVQSGMINDGATLELPVHPGQHTLQAFGTVSTPNSGMVQFLVNAGEIRRFQLSVNTFSNTTSLKMVG